MISIRKYSIVAPTGAFGNHLRWLLLLDPTFNFTVTNEYNVFLDFTSKEKKIESIEKYVYPNRRSWHNWLQFEWKFRDRLEPYIEFDHWVDIVDPDRKYLFLVPEEVESTVKSYLKFNSNLNNCSRENFISEITRFNEHSKMLSFTNANIRLLKSEILFSLELDKNFYQTAIDHFELSDCYEDANYIHNQWYKLHKKAEVELVENFTKIYKE